MADISANLALPYLIASQAQKHVTINETISALDTLVMLCVKSRNLNTPPTNPIEGAAYIIGPAQTNEWATKANQIAVFRDLGWQYRTPKIGFLAYCEVDNAFLSFNSNGWAAIANAIGNIQNANLFGLRTTADNTNPFAIKANKALFAAQSTQEGGNGNFQATMNKSATNNTTAILLQSNYSGRAEIGIIGDDNLSIKVSPDGTLWKTALKIDKSSAKTFVNFGLEFPINLSGENSFIYHGNNCIFHRFRANGTDGQNTFLGENCGNFLMSGTGAEASYNSAYGTNALSSNTIGGSNAAFGVSSLLLNTSGSANSALGLGAMYRNTSGSSNSAFGYTALYANTTGTYNTAIGYQALRYKTDGTDNTNFTNCTGIGSYSRVSGSNQIQLGGSGTSTYAYGSIQDRSDIRDKADIRDTILGLEFIKKLRPVDFRWDMRDDYLQTSNAPIEVLTSDANTNSPQTPIQKDGSKKRNRFHHGLIAQEVKATIDELEIDFGGYQDHSLNYGTDVQTIGYSELIAPIIKAIQQLSQRLEQIEAQILAE